MINIVLGRRARFKLWLHDILIDREPDPLGFHTIEYAHPSLCLPYPRIEFTQIPVRYDTKAYLIYLGFSSDQTKLIYDKCKLEAKELSDINDATLMRYAHEEVLDNYQDSMWDTAFVESFRSEVKELESRHDRKGMAGDRKSPTGPAKKRTTDYIKECIWQRNANLQQFEMIVLGNPDW